MPRQFPRFIFEEPQNTKTQGPFIVHTLSPKFICKVFPKDRKGNGPFFFSYDNCTIEVLELWERHVDVEVLKKTVNDLHTWLIYRK